MICSPTIRPAACSRGSSGIDRSRRSKRGGAPIWLIHDEIYREQTLRRCRISGRTLSVHDRHQLGEQEQRAYRPAPGVDPGADAFVEQAIKAHAWVTSCADSFAQNVALHVFTTLEGVREHAPWYIEQRSAVATGLRESGLRALPIDGSFYACVRLPDGMPSLDAAMELIENYDVLAIPGAAFGPTFESWLRLSWVAPVDRVREGITRIEASRAAALSP